VSCEGIKEKNSLPGYETCDNNNQSRTTRFNRELDEEFWDRFKEYLKVTHREKSIICRLSYAKKYHHVLLEGNAKDILSLSDQKRLQVMKSLASLSKVYGLL
jgi:hypothetical protein